jgi:glycosyltransferase involved in cell wall biosynthesis
MSLDLFGHRDADVGGAVRYSVTNLAAAQARVGDRPTIHLLSGAKRHCHSFEGVNVEFHRCYELSLGTDVERRFARQFSRSMLVALARDRPDVVHFHGARQFHLMFAAVAWQTTRLRVPLVAQERGFREVGKIETAAQCYGIERSDVLLAASEDGRGKLNALSARARMIEVLPNGFDPTIFAPASHRDRDPNAPFNVLIVSRLSEEKDPLVMAEGLREFSRRGHPLAATIISDGPLKQDVAGLLRRAGVDAVFHDHMAQDRLPDYYRSADALLVTSRQGEGWTQVIVEGMACGVPVIASDVPGARDALGAAGVLVPPGAASAIADALESLVDRPELWSRCRQDGIARAQAFTWAAVARRVRSIYVSLSPQTFAQPATSRVT